MNCPCGRVATNAVVLGLFAQSFCTDCANKCLGLKVGQSLMCRSTVVVKDVDGSGIFFVKGDKFYIQSIEYLDVARKHVHCFDIVDNTARITLVPSVTMPLGAGMRYKPIGQNEPILALEEVLESISVLQWDLNTATEKVVQIVKGSYRISHSTLGHCGYITAADWESAKGKYEPA